MSADTEPFAGEDPRRLSMPEWRVLIDWRLRQVENRLDSIFRALVSLAVILVSGLVLFWVTHGNPASVAEHIARLL